MAKCAVCGRYLSVKGGATCSNSKCSNKYHLACLLLPESAQISSDWACPDCKKKLPRGESNAISNRELPSGSPETSEPVLLPVHGAVAGLPDTVMQTVSTACAVSEPSPDTQLTLREEIKLFRSELREIRDELREFRREMAELHTSHGVCTQRVDGLEAKIEAIEKRQSAAVPDGNVSQLERTVARLQLELNDRDQELLSSDLEIANIPEMPGENIVHTVVLVATKLGVSLEERDIVYAQRVGIRIERKVPTGMVMGGDGPVGGGSPTGGANSAGGTGASARGRRIVVRLTRRALRDELLQSARVRRGANTADLGLPAPPRRFFLNERLTKTNKYLFYRVREAASRLGWRYTWTKFGRILAKQGDGKATHCIRSEEDLTRVFGREVSMDEEN